MNAKILFAAIAVAATAFSGIARADEADGSQFVIKFEGSRARAEVIAEATREARTHGTEPAGSRVAQPMRTDLQVKEVRAEAAQALRMGKIPAGEFSL